MPFHRVHKVGQKETFGKSERRDVKRIESDRIFVVFVRRLRSVVAAEHARVAFPDKTRSGTVAPLH